MIVAGHDAIGNRLPPHLLLRLLTVADNMAVQTEPPKADPPKRKRRRFQFSLRSLMIFTLICAVGSAWVARRIEQKRREREAADAIVELGGQVAYDYQVNPTGGFVASAKPPGPDWLRTLFGEHFFSELKVVNLNGRVKVNDAGLINLRGLILQR